MDVEARLSEAARLQRSGDLGAAAEVYAELLVEGHVAGEAHFGLGTLSLQQGDLDAALSHFEAAVAEIPEVSEYRFSLGVVLERMGRVDEALALYEQAAEHAGGRAEVLAAVADRLLQRGRPERVLQLLPTRSDAPAVLNARARACAALGRWTEAFDLLKALARALPGEPAVQRQLAVAAGHLRDYPAAIEAFDRYLTLRGTPDAMDLAAQADLLLLARRPEAARSSVSRAIRQGANGYAVHLLAARCHRLAGDIDDARTALRRTLAIRPETGEAWQLLLEIDPDSGDELLAAAPRLLAERAGDARDRRLLRFAAGQAHARRGDQERAFESWRQANADHAAALVAAGSAYDPVAAEMERERLMELFPARSARRAEQGTEAPIFIVGPPRSGTTLVERILSGIEGVRTSGENEAMGFIASRLLFDVERRGHAAPAELGASDWEALADEYWERSEAEPCRLTDKMPHNFRHLGLIDAMFPGAPVLWMRRDPRDVGLSIYQRAFPDGHAYACDLRAIGHFLAECERLMRFWQSTLPGRVLEIDYERLIAEPEAVAREILAFCSLDWDPACLDVERRTGPAFTFSEMQVRRPINADGVGRWRTFETQLRPLVASLREQGVELPD